MANVFSKIFSFIKKLFTRPGLQAFLAKHQALGVAIVERLSEVHTNEDFHHWKDQAWEELQKATGELRGNWISLLLGFAFEELKARQTKP